MTLIEQLKTIKDPRGQQGKRHPLWQVLFVSLWGSLCGYWGYRPLAKFCQKHHDQPCQLLELDPKPILPSYSTFGRGFQQLDAQAWVDAFNVWAILHASKLAGLLWSVDGKSIKCTSVGGNSSQQDFAVLVSLYGQTCRSGAIRIDGQRQSQ